MTAPLNNLRIADEFGTGPTYKQTCCEGQYYTALPTLGTYTVLAIAFCLYLFNGAIRLLIKRRLLQELGRDLLP